MNSSMRTNPSHPNRAIRRIRPAHPHRVAVRLGPGSGSRGEFIGIFLEFAQADSKNFTPVVVISRAARSCQSKNATYRNFLPLFSQATFSRYFFLAGNSMLPGARPFLRH